MSKGSVFVSEILVLSSAILLLLGQLCHGDVGTATYYKPPYLPTACGGNDVSLFPANSMFAAAGEEIWENGAACGRRYKVRCLSATVANTCVRDEIIELIIVDRAISTVSKPLTPGATMVMSHTAYASIVRNDLSRVSIEYMER